MNNQRRHTLKRARDLLEQAILLIEEAREGEEESFENLPDPLQQGERGERMQQTISDLEEASSAVEEAMGQIDSAKGGDA